MNVLILFAALAGVTAPTNNCQSKACAPQAVVVAAPTCQSGVCGVQHSVTRSVTRTVTRQSIAQRKALIQAQRGRMFHPGGSFGGARYEGCGMGSTRDQAIRNCCYWGRRKAVDIGTAYSQRTRRWYATVLYQ